MNYKILAIGAICFLAFSIGAYKLGQVSVTKSESNSVFQAVYIAPSPTPTISPTNTPIPTPTNTPISEEAEKWIQIKEKSKQKGITCKESNQGEIYNPKEIIKLNSGLTVTLERITTSINEGFSSRVNYFVIADISLMNLSSNNYYIDRNSFTLLDKLGFASSPSNGFNAYTRGDISGKLQKYEFKRGEVAFEVSGSQSSFVLNFKSGENEEMLTFTVDVTKILKGVTK